MKHERYISMNQEEKEFLKNYDITKYERPSIAADMAIFSILQEAEADNFRKLPKKTLKILLIKRASYPFKNAWALPGGFCRPDEDVYETARRELYEETNISNAYLNLSGIFGEIGRDPRGWVISNTFLALLDGEQCKLRAGTDAWEAKWFSIEVNKKVIKHQCDEVSAELETEYDIALIHTPSDTRLYAKVKETKQFQNYHETVHYEILENNGLAFDHAKIILHAFLTLQNRAENEIRIVFDLMPELFTLNQLQKAFEMILQKELTTPNFRRKIADYVIETEHIKDGAGHRPAKLFKRNVKKFAGVLDGHSQY